MKFLEAFENLKEGQMITSNTNPSANTPLEVRWDWGSAKPNFARGYIPLRQHVQVITIPKPKTELKDVLAKLINADMDEVKRIAQVLAKADIDWDAEAEKLI